MTPETMKLRGSNKRKITKDKYGENVPNLEITEVLLVRCNIVNNDYQQDSRVLYTFIPNKLFGQLQDISPKNVIFLKTFNSEKEDKINITLVLISSVKYKKWCNIQFNLEIEY